jgi:hypothetical protein
MELKQFELKKGKISLPGRVRDFFVADFFGNSIVHWILIGSFFLNIANWVALSIFIRPVDFPIILHYNVYFGVDIIGDWWQAYFLPATGVIMLLINAILAHFFYKRKERIASYLLLLAGFVIQVGIAISSASIILINY